MRNIFVFVLFKSIESLAQKLETLWCKSKIMYIAVNNHVSINNNYAQY